MFQERGIVSIIEETGEVARTVVGALKSQPALLLMFLLNIIFVTAGYLIMDRAEESSQERFSVIIDRCFIRSSDERYHELFRTTPQARYALDRSQRGQGEFP